MLAFNANSARCGCGAVGVVNACARGGLPREELSILFFPVHD